MCRYGEIIGGVMKTLKEIESAIDAAMYASCKAMVDTQVILQLLVQKEIVTREEVQTMREKVEKNSEYGQILTPLIAKIAYEHDKQIDEHIDILMMSKVLNPDSTSEKDNELLQQLLQRKYASQDKEKYFKDLGIYNVIEKINNNEPLTEEEKQKTLKVMEDLLNKKDGD